MEAKDTYQPISCNLYDQLEAWATLKTKLSLTYVDVSGQEVTMVGTIIDFKTKEGEEWATLENDLEVRLDKFTTIRPI